MCGTNHASSVTGTPEAPAAQMAAAPVAKEAAVETGLQMICGRVHDNILEASSQGISGQDVPAEQISSWIRENPAVLKGITELFLRSSQLRGVPGNIGVFSNLRRLALNDNLLESLPPGTFDRLDQLVELDLSGNQLETLSSNAFRGLIHLEGLYLANNRLKRLSPGVFEGVSQLQRLYLTHNRLKTLSPQIFHGLDNLRWLCLAHNRIRALSPGAFGKLPALRGLALQNNRLETLSKGAFEGLTGLRGLELQNNQLKALGSGVFDGLAHLCGVSLQGNPLRALYPRINHDLSTGMLQKLYWGLGEDKWRECIDGMYHSLGKFVFDEGLHGSTVEPGFISSMETAFAFIGQFPGKKIDADWYLHLHRHTCAHFDGDSDVCLMGQEKVGVFRNSDDPICCTFQGPCSLLFQAKGEFEARNAALQKEFGSTYGLGEMVYTARQSVLLVYRRMSRKQVRRIFNWYLNRFYAEVERADNPDARLMAIARWHQRVEWLHPVKDGATRTNVALMNKLLTDYGFHPALLECPHVPSSYSLAQWKEYLQNGLVQWEKYYGS
jgi:Leucine-rich repeat (LRR) protein